MRFTCKSRGKGNVVGSSLVYLPAPACPSLPHPSIHPSPNPKRPRGDTLSLARSQGIHEFRAEVERRFPGQHLARAAATDLVDPQWQRRDYFGAHPQKQQGLHYVGIHVPVGRLQASDMLELARIADAYGTGELRLTVEQNVIIPNVPTDKVASLLEEPLLAGGGKLSATPTPLFSTLVACTGSQFCGQAVIETKARAVQVTRELEATVELARPVRMHWTGCPNSCAQVQVADIGFMGCMAKDENRKPVEGVDIFVGGRIGSDSHLGEKVVSAVPCKDVVPVVQELLVKHFGAKLKKKQSDPEQASS